MRKKDRRRGPLGKFHVLAFFFYDVLSILLKGQLLMCLHKYILNSKDLSFEIRHQLRIKLQKCVFVISVEALRPELAGYIRDFTLFANKFKQGLLVSPL